MEQKIVFRQLLDELREKGIQNKRTLSKDEVRAFLGHAGLNDEQLQMVYAYLTDQKIRVEGFEDTRSPQQAGEFATRSVSKAEGPDEEQNPQPETDEESENVIGLYLDELSDIDTLDPQLELLLFQKAAAGDADAKERLICAYLPVVCDMVGEMESEEMLPEDLIQEGNMGLILAMDQLEKKDSLAAYQADLMNKVSRSLEEALDMFSDRKQSNERMIGRISHLDEAIRNLENQLERKVTAEELSAYLEMSVDEIRDILRLAGDSPEE